VLLVAPLFIFSAKMFNASKLTDRLFARQRAGGQGPGTGHRTSSTYDFRRHVRLELADVAGPGSMEGV
jgi:hypothetical protein